MTLFDCCSNSLFAILIAWGLVEDLAVAIACAKVKGWQRSDTDNAHAKPRSFDTGPPNSCPPNSYGEELKSIPACDPISS